MKTTEEILDMMRHHDTPLTDAVINTFDGNQSKLAADLATHVEELERELEQSRQDRIAGAECSKRLAAKLAACSPNLSAALEWAASDGSDKDLAQRLENLGKWGMAGDNALEIVALEYERVMAAIREYRDAKGRHHTQIATERLFALLPESD